MMRKQKLMTNKYNHKIIFISIIFFLMKTYMGMQRNIQNNIYIYIYIYIYI